MQPRQTSKVPWPLQSVETALTPFLSLSLSIFALSAAVEARTQQQGYRGSVIPQFIYCFKEALVCESKKGVFLNL